MRSRALATAIVVLALSATTACEPASPPPTFEVRTHATGADEAPGDGECRTAMGSCTLQAAIEESNALGKGVVLVAASTTDHPGFDATITGHVTIKADGAGSSFDSVTIGSGEPVVFTVAAGAALILESVDINGSIVVDGGFVASRLAVRSVQVGPTGAAIMTNTVFLPNDAPALVNHGRAFLQYSTVAVWDGGGLVTFGDGVTTISATAVLGMENDSPTTCFGTAPVSLGYNAVVDTECGLTGPGDRQDVPGLTEYHLLPDPDSVLVDAIPVGTLGCGTAVTTDARGPFGVRPVDGNDDGTSGCDIGAYEREQPLS